MTFNLRSDGSADGGVREWQGRKESCWGGGVEEEQEEDENEVWLERSIPAHSSSSKGIRFLTPSSKDWRREEGG